jgi:rhodanese-related sulfurtransferase
MVVRVKKIHLVDPQAPSSWGTSSLLGAADEEEYRRNIRYYPRNAPLQLLEVEYAHGPRNLTDRGTQIESSVFKPMDWSKSIQGLTWVDVRSKSEFAKSHAKNAINVEYVKNSPGDVLFYRSFEYFGAIDHFSTDRLPRNKDTPLVFVGTSLVDIRPFRALIMAHVEGWKNLYWLRDGEMGRLHIVSETPPSVPDVVTLQNGGDLAQLESKTHTKLISVEMDKIYSGYHPILESVNIPIDDLSQTFPIQKLPKDKETPLVIFGTDFYDQNALRSTRWVKEAGWKNVYWYRGGRMDWESR